VRRLVIGSPGNPHRGPFNERTRMDKLLSVSTIAWDYITAQCRPVNRRREVYALVAFCTIRTASSRRTTSWTPRVSEGREPNGMGIVPAVPVYPPDPKNPVGGEGEGAGIGLAGMKTSGDRFRSR